MIWVAITWISALGIAQYRTLSKVPPRECLTWAFLCSVALAMSAMVTWQVKPGIHPLAWLEFLFGPPTRLLYRVL